MDFWVDFKKGVKNPFDKISTLNYDDSTKSERTKEHNVGYKKKIKKLRSAIMLEAISINQHQLDLEARVDKLEAEAKRNRAKAVHPSSNKFYNFDKDENGNQRANLIPNPTFDMEAPTSTKRVTFSLPKRLGTRLFKANDSDVRFLGLLGVAFSASPIGASEAGMWAVEFGPFVTTKSPRALHEAINKHFAGRFGFVMQVERV